MCSSKHLNTFNTEFRRNRGKRVGGRPSYRDVKKKEKEKRWFMN